jgi:hypothetical protein
MGTASEMYTEFMQNNPKSEFSHFQIESGSFETLIKLA